MMKRKQDPKIAFLALLATICLTTLFIRVPLPSRGYFNFGDVAVVFGALVLGDIDPKKGWLWGMCAGGFGSAIADIVGGFAIFFPITLIAKGAEGTLASLAVKQDASYIRYGLLGIGGGLMVIVYFVGTALLPSIGYQGAVADIVPNIIQAVGGFIGGQLAFTAYKTMVGGQE